MLPHAAYMILFLTLSETHPLIISSMNHWKTTTVVKQKNKYLITYYDSTWSKSWFAKILDSANEDKAEFMVSVTHLYLLLREFFISIEHYAMYSNIGLSNMKHMIQKKASCQPWLLICHSSMSSNYIRAYWKLAITQLWNQLVLHFIYHMYNTEAPEYAELILHNLVIHLNRVVVLLNTIDSKTPKFYLHNAQPPLSWVLRFLTIRMQRLVICSIGSTPGMRPAAIALGLRSANFSFWNISSQYLQYHLFCGMLGREMHSESRRAQMKTFWEK